MARWKNLIYWVFKVSAVITVVTDITTLASIRPHIIMPAPSTALLVGVLFIIQVDMV